MGVDKKLMAHLFDLEGAVVERNNVHADVISSRSPSLNFLFGNGWGLPRGYSLVLFGPPKSGKSVILRSMIAQTHADYPDAVAVVFNTEFREKGQLSKSLAKKWGIDLERYVAFDVNSPELIFDRIEKDLADMAQKGLDIRLVAIDSISGIQGRRSMNSDSIMQQQIGDLALTIQEGLKRILPIQRKYNFAMVLTTQIRAELDQWEVKRGHKYKMAASYGLQHHGEYFMCVEANNTADGKKDLLGKEYTNEDLKDLKGDAEKTGHRIRVNMRDSSMGPKGRSGEFTFSDNDGIINVHEEVFSLGCARGIVERPNNTAYIYKDKKWVGKESFLMALKENPELQAAILKDLKAKDTAGLFDETSDPEV
jgi:RecA/RadA recombinase